MLPLASNDLQVEWMMTDVYKRKGKGTNGPMYTHTILYT